MLDRGIARIEMIATGGESICTRTSTEGALLCVHHATSLCRFWIGMGCFSFPEILSRSTTVGIGARWLQRGGFWA